MRILIVRLSAMGDIVHTLPLAENARRAGVEVGWLVERSHAGVLEGNPSIDRLFVAETRSWRRNPLGSTTRRDLDRLSAELAEFHADYAIEAHGLWKSILVARLAHAPIVSLRRRDRREPSSGVFVDHRVRLEPGAVHVVDQNLLLLRPLGIPVVARAPDARYLLAREHTTAENFLATLPRPFALYHPGAARPAKAWGEDRYARLAGRLATERNLVPVVSWGPGDEERVARFAEQLPQARVMPRLDLRGLARVTNAASLFVAGDTGPAHLADALGRPTLALFGPTSGRRNVPERNRPYRGWAMRYDETTSTDEVAARAAEILNQIETSPSATGA
jgi:lipopolysaccharide heptosyltransferase I